MSIRHSVLFLILLVCVAYAGSTQAQEAIGSFPSPGEEPRGLAWDGEYLWCADAGTDSVYKLDISDGTVISSFWLPINLEYGGITWGSDTTIWVADGSMIYEVNPTNGAVISSFSCPGG
jgi:DNA-binding beta-propeller fold protein YncE